MAAPAACEPGVLMSVSFYDQNADNFIEQTADVDMSSLYERFSRLLPDGGSILDAGSGSGRDALAFSQMGYDVEAFDASKKMVDATRRRAGVPTHHASFQGIQLNRKFHGIWACASLLHVPRVELSEVLNRLSGCLDPSGILYASFKYGDEEREKCGRYFNDMNEGLINEQLANVKSLELLETWTTADQRRERSNELWLNCILKKVDSRQYKNT
jgi:SAM-dependent methyltransferase